MSIDTSEGINGCPSKGYGSCVRLLARWATSPFDAPIRVRKAGVRSRLDRRNHTTAGGPSVPKIKKS